jgi:hypothetical protein
MLSGEILYLETGVNKQEDSHLHCDNDDICKKEKTMTDSQTNPRVAAIRQRLATAYQSLNELLDGPLARLEAEGLYRAPQEEEWTVTENLAHIVEFMPYWGGEIEKLVARPGANFGRTKQHEGRLRAISEHGHDTLSEIRAQLPTSYAHLDTILSHLTDQDPDITGQHSTFGERSLDWFIEEFVTRHLEDHVKQIREALQRIQ